MLLTVLDWDKLSSNDHIGGVTLDIKELIKNTPQRDPHTGLYKADEDKGFGGGEKTAWDDPVQSPAVDRKGDAMGGETRPRHSVQVSFLKS